METTVSKKTITEITGSFSEEDVVNILTEHLQRLYDLKRSEVYIDVDGTSFDCYGVIPFKVTKVEVKSE